jgi:Amt family ammonium transporter
MHAGFAMLETGCCRAKNASNVLMKNLVNVCLGTLAWYAVGYGFAYGMGDNVPEEDSGGNGFIGLNGWFGHDSSSRIPTGTTFRPVQSWLGSSSGHSAPSPPPSSAVPSPSGCSAPRTGSTSCS